MSGPAVSDVITGRGAINWEERKPAKKFEWGSGANLVGVLVGISKAEIRDPKTRMPKAVVRYSVKEWESDEMVFFFGSVQLDEMLRPADVGHFLNIICTGEDKEAGRNGNSMRTFRVQVSRDLAPGYAPVYADDGSPITDKDLPEREFFG